MSHDLRIGDLVKLKRHCTRIKLQGASQDEWWTNRSTIALIVNKHYLLSEDGAELFLILFDNRLWWIEGCDVVSFS